MIERLAPVVLRALREREAALRVPFLGANVLDILAVVEVPLWATPAHGVEALDHLEREGWVARVPLDELEPLAGRGLPLRQYWPAGVTHGWRVKSALDLL